MKNTVVTKLGPGKIAEIKKMPDGSFEIVQFVDKENKVAPRMKDAIDEKMLVPIEASKLSLNDDFMKHLPRDEFEKKLKEKITEVINRGAKDFYRPKVDPSFSKDGKGIRYILGGEPAVGKSYTWWENSARALCPERNSRLGTEAEYIAFLGVLMKSMLESGKHIEWVWTVVCLNSKMIGHYSNSENFKHRLEHTGSRPLCKVFYDLANTHKILAIDESTHLFTQVSGAYINFGEDNPIFSSFLNYNVRENLNNAVGWIVMD